MSFMYMQEETDPPCLDSYKQTKALSFSGRGGEMKMSEIVPVRFRAPGGGKSDKNKLVW